MYTALKTVKKATSKVVKMKPKSLPVAQLRNMTSTELRKLSAVETSHLLFTKSLTFLAENIKNAPMKGAKTSWQRRDMFRQLVFCLQDDSNAVFKFLQAWEASNADLRFVANISRWERNATKKAKLRLPSFIEGLERYIKTVDKFSVTDADALLKSFPDAVANCPLLLQRAGLGKIVYLDYLKKNKSRYAYEKAVAEVGQSFTSIKKKTVLRQLFAKHKLLFKYVTVDRIEESVLDAKEFTYVLVRCKPRELSKDVIDYLESTTFLHTITGDIKHTKILRKALAKLKDKYLEDDEKDSFGTDNTTTEDTNGHETNTAA